MTTYTINIENKSGRPQAYFIFNQPTIPNPRPAAEVWSNVFATKAVADKASDKFIFKLGYTAVVGSASESPRDKALVKVDRNEPVTLGTGSTPGTTKLAYLTAGQAPQFWKPDPSPSAEMNSLEIDTNDKFTYEEAKKNNYLVGFGGDQEGAMVTWIPEPQRRYQIKPAAIFYFAVGEYKKDQMVKYDQVITAKIPVDFPLLNTQTASIRHQADGVLVLVPNPKQ